MDDDNEAALSFASLFIKNFAAEYLTAMIGQPFEVGGTLLQVEYRPRKRIAQARGLVNDLPPINTQEDGDELETVSGGA